MSWVPNVPPDDYARALRLVISWIEEDDFSLTAAAKEAESAGPVNALVVALTALAAGFATIQADGPEPASEMLRTYLLLLAGDQEDA